MAERKAQARSKTAALSYRAKRWMLAVALWRSCSDGIKESIHSALHFCSAKPHAPTMKTLITYVAEDNAIILENLIETLSEIADVQVAAFSATESEAKRWLALHDGNWHLAILDLFLEQGSGLGVLAACADRQSHQKVVLLTNFATVDIRRRAKELGADAVFDKSTELDSLFDFCRKQAQLCY